MYNILVCDDDRDIVRALRIYLSTGEYRVLEAYTGREALDIVEKEDVSLVLMDVMMPELDGISATEKLREITNVPILLLTAKGESSDKVLGLTAGADDYIVKPFDPMELLARVRSQLRRYTTLGGTPAAPAALTLGGIVLNDDTKEVSVDGESVSLTPIEFDLLKFLLQNPGKVFSSRELYEKVWKESVLGSQGVVPVHIRHLREKLEINPSEPRYLKVVWGRGYKLEDKP